jgi:hypothetical protein
VEVALFENPKFTSLAEAPLPVVAAQLPISPVGL